MTQKKIVLIDGSSLAFRAFYSILDIEKFKNKEGLHTNALYSFHRMIDSVLEQFQPTHILVAFDKSERTFRTEKYADYKGGRQKTPPEFKEQMPYLRVFLKGYGIEYYDLLGYEADDIIGTFSRLANPEDEVVVISGDRDLIQLANENTTVYITKKGVSDLEAYTPQTIEDKYQLSPEQIIDLKGMMGDSSDNYPGITRIGEKTALKLLHQFGSLEGLYAGLDELKPSKMKDNILADEEQARMSKDLARIVTDAPVEIDLEAIKRQPLDLDVLVNFYQQMDFKSFLTQLKEGADLAEDLLEPVAYPSLSTKWVENIEAETLPQKAILYLETLEENYHFAPLLALSWMDLEGDVAYMTTPDYALASPHFIAWLENPEVEIISFDSKRDRVLLAREGINLQGISFDVSIAAYLLDPGQAPSLVSSLDLVKERTGLQEDEAVYGKGAKLALPERPVLEKHLANKVQVLQILIKQLPSLLKERDEWDLYREIEFPLAQVLTKMEVRGIKTQAATLEEMNQTLLDRLAILEKEIQDLAGSSFNISSPKQLAQVLFEDLGLPALKKTKTGYSTAADVLEKLRYAHPIVEKLLDYRQISKLQGTYLAGLPKYIKSDGHIHTRYVQTLTQTGRLSSTDPNLQNIPIRLEEGRQIRKAFVASQEDWILFGADYSQIELRVLAHISGDQHMQEAFIKGEDIHASTARRVFGLGEDEEVTSDHRRQAKAVNFGIVYGISDYGLSQNLGISRKEAQSFIDRYFEKYPGVAQYMEDIVKKARQDGYVSTLFNRRRYLPDIHSSKFNIRSFAERTAMNSPIQGTAADILKVAMINLEKAIESEGLEANILLQVHDELILEAPRSEVDRLKVLVPQIMEEAANLAIPLKVDYGFGSNWYELK